MDISRRGSSADHGPSSINLKDPSVSWNEANKAVEIKKGSVKDFSTESRHNYTISLSLDEIAKIFHAVASAANKNPELLAEMQAQTLKSLLQIQAAIVGFSNQNTTINR
jgi:hypothetical protein